MAVTVLALPYYVLGGTPASDIGRALKVHEAPHPGDVAESAIHAAINGGVLYGVLRLFGVSSHRALGVSAGVSGAIALGMVYNGYKNAPTAKG